jgi:two-component system, chemotaxis family, chemotaxis protein CheY
MHVNPCHPALVVDDFKSVSSITARVLNAMGFSSVDIAETGEEALEMARTRFYGLIVSDLHMKPIGGVDLLRRLKRDRRTSSTPVIILTGDPLTSAAKTARQAGASAVVEKPPSPGELSARLGEATGGNG